MEVLSIKDYRKSFGDTEVLKGIDFTLNEGETLAIIGSSGSGKTTLLRCLNFLETPDNGSMYLHGKLLYDAQADKKLSEKKLRDRRLHFGLVFQNFNLFPQYTALENVCLAPKLRVEKKNRKEKQLIFSEIEKNAAELLARVGLSDKCNNYPAQLSGGQQQRVAIARALALRPDILCFDEPTSALDPELTGEVLKVLRKLADEKTTMIIVTHEMNFAREVADKIIFMDKGVVAAVGTPDEIFCSDNDRLNAFIGKINSKQ